VLIEVLPEQISAAWDRIRPKIREALPGFVSVNEEALSNILFALTTERGKFWLYVDEENNVPVGFVITTIQHDRLTNARSMLIYTIYAFMEISDEQWRDGLETLQRDAKARGLDGIVAYSDNEALIRYLEQRGAKADFRLIDFGDYGKRRN